MELANRIQDAFDNIKTEPQLIESTKQFLSKKRRNSRMPSRRPMFYGALAAVCMALFLLAGIGGYSWAQTPVSYVAIDVNPSIELALNRFDRVVSVRGYNTEGMEILKDLPLRGKLYTAAIELIMGSKAMAAYLSEGADLVFTIAADSQRESALKSGAESSASHCGHSSQSASVDLESALQAHTYGLSLGKYYAWLQLIQYDDSVTIEDCRDMSMAELHRRISEYESGEEEYPNEDTMQEDGNTYEEEHHLEEDTYEEEHHLEGDAYGEEYPLEEDAYDEGYVPEEGDASPQEHHPEEIEDHGNGNHSEYGTATENESVSAETEPTYTESPPDTAATQETGQQQNNNGHGHRYRQQRGHH